MMRLGAGKAQVKTDREAQNGPSARDCFRITTARFNERIGLISPVEMSLENTTGIIRVERLPDRAIQQLQWLHAPC
jgi:hypothetical protein